MNTFYLLRHGEVCVDKSKPPSEWALTRKGVEDVFELARKGTFAKVDFVCSSEEKKAFHTAQIIADSIGKEALKLSNFNELHRNTFVGNYESAIRKAFARINESSGDWEPCLSALHRFREGAEQMNMKHRNKKILIVSHGITLTLYFAHLNGKMNELFTRWKKLSFLSYGVVKDSQVVKDIV